MISTDIDLAPPETLSSILRAEVKLREWGDVALLISVRDPESGEVVQWEQHASGHIADQLRAAVSCPILFEGKPIGYIDLRATIPSLKPAYLMRLAQGLHDDIILGFSQRAQLRAA